MNIPRVVVAAHVSDVVHWWMRVFAVRAWLGCPLVQFPPAGGWLLWGSGCWGPLTPRQKQ